MRLAFWRAGKDKAGRAKAVLEKAVLKKAAVQKAAAKPAPDFHKPAAAPPTGDLDLRALGQALARKKGWIIVPTLLAAVLSVTAVNLVTPRYKSEARILVDGRENVFLRPNGERNEERTSVVDAEAVTSQVQLLLSRDLAREIIKKNKLAERPEFDPVLQGLSPFKSLLALFGIGRDPFSLTPEERVLDAFYDRFTAYAVDKSRVIVIEFQSWDPELAARVANSIAEGYLVLQQNARQEQAKSAGLWLSGEIDSLRKKVAEAESRVEDFRSKSSLFVGTNNTTLSNQQMGELNTQLNNARALKSDAESKARLIREMLQSGKPIEASEVLNSELTRRLSEQRVTLRAQLAEQSSTLLDNHPRIKELKAQLNDLDRQLREEASKLSRSFDSDARIAGGRVEGLSASLEQVKKQAGSTNTQDVQLRALEREAKAQRDLLESLPREIPRGQHPREYRRRPRRRPDHFPRQRLQHAGLSEEAADRADRDAGNPDAHRRRDRDRRTAAHDGAARGGRVRLRAGCDPPLPRLRPSRPPPSPSSNSNRKPSPKRLRCSANLPVSCSRHRARTLRHGATGR